MSFHAKQQSQRQNRVQLAPLGLESRLLRGPAPLLCGLGWRTPMVSPCRIRLRGDLAGLGEGPSPLPGMGSRGISKLGGPIPFTRPSFRDAQCHSFHGSLFPGTGGSVSQLSMDMAFMSCSTL